MITFKPETYSSDWNIGLIFYNRIFVGSCILWQGAVKQSWYDRSSGGFTQPMPDVERLWNSAWHRLYHTSGEIYFKTKQFNIPLFIKPILSEEAVIQFGISFVNGGLFINWSLQNLSLSIQEKLQSILTIIIVQAELNEIRKCSRQMNDNQDALCLMFD